MNKINLLHDCKLFAFYISRFQIFAALAIGGLGGISVGAVLGFSAILLPKLGSDVSVTEKSWIGNYSVYLFY